MRKRFTSMLMSLALCLSLCVPALAVSEMTDTVTLQLPNEDVKYQQICDDCVDSEQDSDSDDIVIAYIEFGGSSSETGSNSNAISTNGFVTVDFDNVGWAKYTLHRTGLNRFLFQLEWGGNAHVSGFRATSIEVFNGSFLSPRETEPYAAFTNWHGNAHGYQRGTMAIGSFSVPEGVHFVTIKTVGLQAYLLHTAAWISMYDGERTVCLDLAR